MNHEVEMLLDHPNDNHPNVVVDERVIRAISQS